MDSGQRFVGRRIIVTGAGSGIGRATVHRLFDEGAQILATDISEQRIIELFESIGDEIDTVVGDIAQPDVIARVLDLAGDRIDGLANVAGIMDGFLPTEEIDDATWDRVLAVNLTAPMRLTRAVLPRMLDAGAGSIVHVGSEAGQRGSCAGTAYTVSKHAINGLSASTAFFYTPRGVRSNVVAPGAVATNIEAPFLSTWAQERLGPLMQVAIPPVAQPEQLAAAIAWLLSDDASNVSGTVLSVDGGWAAL